MESKEYNDLFDLAISIRDEGLTLEDNGDLAKSGEKFWRAIEIFEQLYPIDIQPDKFNKTLILGGLYKWVGNVEKSFQFFNTAVNLKPDSEIASLSLYLSFIELGKSDLAINEIKRYLDLYPAKLYLDTLNELLEDLKNGYATTFKGIILQLANKNGIPV